MVFLCFDHHDQYDSTTSQSKNLTQGEVRHYRDELQREIDAEWKQPAQFEVTPLLDITGISGHYVWETPNESAELDIEALGNNMISVTGIALWGTTREFGPNIGELDFKGILSRNAVHYCNPHSDYEVTIQFTFGGLTVTEKNAQGEFGMNVTFAGEFRKAIEKTQEQIIPGRDLTLSLREGNIFTRTNKKEKQLTFCGCDSDPVLLENNKILFIRFEEGFRPSIEDEDENVTYRCHKIMTVDIETLLEETITQRKPFEDGLDGTREILRVENPALSLDGKYLYFVTEKYATASQFVKVEIQSGKWIELFSAESFELITEGPHKNRFLVATSEIRTKGRDIYYSLRDEEGKVYKEFDSEKSLMKFRSLL